MKNQFCLNCGHTLSCHQSIGKNAQGKYIPIFECQWCLCSLDWTVFEAEQESVENVRG